jgi:outer membrane protein OmpA-like peptidoglycan-associated protein
MLKDQANANTDSIGALKDRGVDSLNATKSRFVDSITAITDRARDSLAAINVRFDNINKYDVRDSVAVLFATGSATLSEADKRALDAIVSTAMAQPGYLIEVMGFTDATGTEGLNLNLSTRRAKTVVDYLIREKQVPIRRVLNPTGFGEEQPVASNDTPAGRAQNRRAQVKVLVNRAVADRK